MMAVATPTSVLKFHLSLNVADIPRAAAFYEVLFGCAPAKMYADYAKFEVAEPAVVLSLVPRMPSAGASLSHLGVHVVDAAALETMRQRLVNAGLEVQVQDCTTCGYARQSKCWTGDPNGNHWEIYVIEEDVSPAQLRKPLEGNAARLEKPTGPAIWEHCVSHPLPARLPFADGTADEIRLIGSCNVAELIDRFEWLVGEATRALKPGGKIFVHGLMADGELKGSLPKLPGLAALVSHVPPFARPLDVLARAGFVHTQFLKCTDAPWFTIRGVGLREVQLSAWKPGADDGSTREVLYKGPFAEIEDDAGTTYPRGQRVAVSTATWELLRLGAAAEQFQFFDPDKSPEVCGP